MDELNPNHPTTKLLRDEWHKIAALLMLKSGEHHVVVTSDDIHQLMEVGANITVQELHDGLHIRLVDDATAIRLARKHGGLPS
jgi:hypothetical protein